MKTIRRITQVSIVEPQQRHREESNRWKIQPNVGPIIADVIQKRTERRRSRSDGLDPHRARHSQLAIENTSIGALRVLQPPRSEWFDFTQVKNSSVDPLLVWENQTRFSRFYWRRRLPSSQPLGHRRSVLPEWSSIMIIRYPLVSHCIECGERTPRSVTAFVPFVRGEAFQSTAGDKQPFTKLDNLVEINESRDSLSVFNFVVIIKTLSSCTMFRK
ncbi:hypothetical protein EVAR_6537_1 [Eumeta japonica]|uniref:Uncharacterized protein n=1 Tax=Eumeta variegata TaxID=151549 RepID=A0A4C1SQZ2_EUMVA|nr:hypothetical protein EVAR_6537_1 [Eumeta japonica]